MKRLLLVITLAVFFAACQKPDPAREPLRVWFMNPAGEKPREVIKRINDRYRASHPGVTVEVEYIPWGDAKSKIKNALLGDVAPDVCELGSTWTPEFSEGGVLLDLTERVEAMPWKNDLLPALQESGSWDGRLYGLPWYGGCRAVIYRKDLFDIKGLQPPETWEDLLRIAAALQTTDPDGRISCYALGLPGRSAHVFLPFIWSNGGEIMRLGEDGRWSPSLTEPASLEAIRFIAELYTTHHFLPEGSKVWDALDARLALANGKAAMIIDGPWAIPSIIKMNPDVEGQLGVAPPPRSKQYATFAGGSHLAIFKKTHRPEDAWDYASIFLEEASLIEWCDTVGFFPGRVSLTEEIVRKGKPYLAVYAEMMKQGRTYPPVPAWGKYEEARLFETMIQRLFDGESPKEAAAWVEKEMRRISRD